MEHAAFLTRGTSVSAGKPGSRCPPRMEHSYITPRAESPRVSPFSPELGTQCAAESAKTSPCARTADELVDSAPFGRVAWSSARQQEVSFVDRATIHGCAGASGAVMYQEKYKAECRREPMVGIATPWRIRLR